MIGVARRLLHLPVLLALASVGLGGLVAVQLRDPPEVPPEVPLGGATESEAVPAMPGDIVEMDGSRTFSPRPLETYTGIAARPLFMPTRRPPPAGGNAAGGQSGHDTLMLAGVILTQTKRLAMIETKRTSGVVVVREGQSVEGWSVDEIGADRVLISQDAEVFELLLDDKLRAPRKEVRRTPRTQSQPQAQAQPQAQPQPSQPVPAEAPAAADPVGDNEGELLDEAEDLGGAG